MWGWIEQRAAVAADAGAKLVETRFGLCGAGFGAADGALDAARRRQALLAWLPIRIIVPDLRQRILGARDRLIKPRLLPGRCPWKPVGCAAPAGVRVLQIVVGVFRIRIRNRFWIAFIIGKP